MSIRILKHIITLILVAFSFSIQPGIAAPKREFRGVWIATVGNIDWPSKKGLSANEQKQEFINKLNFLQSCGFNAVIVQVRPAADAFYESSMEPWSVYLSGKQGVPPAPYYDPLKFMIEEAHKRNMEFHAWFNPYRALVNASSNPNPVNHVTHTRPDWMIRYGTKTYFDPGNPDAREYILKVLLDVVRRYDMDALHIDDYFYPYPEGGREFGDQVCYGKYCVNMSRADWRRENVNTFIKELSSRIKAIKPYVRFGVSPFGIWRNDNKDPLGSATRGSACYDDLYSDVKLWLDKKWVDYMAPQLYWERGHRVAPFDVLLPWWVNHANGRNMYIGLGLYRMANGTGVWSNPNEILAQIRDSRSQHANGIIMYSLSSFNKISPAIADSLRNNYFKTIAIPPSYTWLGDGSQPPSPALKPLVKSAAHPTLNWINNSYADKDLKFAVYRFSGNETVDIQQAENLIALTSETEFTDKKAAGLRNVRYVITSFNRIWVESKPSDVAQWN